MHKSRKKKDLPGRVSMCRIFGLERIRLRLYQGYSCPSMSSETGRVGVEKCAFQDTGADHRLPVTRCGLCQMRPQSVFHNFHNVSSKMKQAQGMRSFLISVSLNHESETETSTEPRKDSLNAPEECLGGISQICNLQMRCSDVYVQIFGGF